MICFCGFPAGAANAVKGEISAQERESEKRKRRLEYEKRRVNQEERKRKERRKKEEEDQREGEEGEEPSKRFVLLHKRRQQQEEEQQEKKDPDPKRPGQTGYGGSVAVSKLVRGDRDRPQQNTAQQQRPRRHPLKQENNLPTPM